MMAQGEASSEKKEGVNNAMAEKGLTPPFGSRKRKNNDKRQ
jgi:hypothetical protein